MEDAIAPRRIDGAISTEGPRGGEGGGICDAMEGVVSFFDREPDGGPGTVEEGVRVPVDAGEDAGAVAGVGRVGAWGAAQAGSRGDVVIGVGVAGRVGVCWDTWEGDVDAGSVEGGEQWGHERGGGRGREVWHGGGRGKAEGRVAKGVNVAVAVTTNSLDSTAVAVGELHSSPKSFHIS